MILDNRLNGGCSSDVLEPILAFFTSGNLGQFVSRKESSPLQISANPIQNSQDVPLIVLVSEELDEDMGSARESKTSSGCYIRYSFYIVPRAEYADGQRHVTCLNNIREGTNY